MFTLSFEGFTLSPEGLRSMSARSQPLVSTRHTDPACAGRRVPQAFRHKEFLLLTLFRPRSAAIPKNPRAKAGCGALGRRVIRQVIVCHRRFRCGIPCRPEE